MEDVFLDGLLPLSSTTSETPATASTPRERAQHGLRGDRIGEADHPGPMMESVRNGRAGWLTDLPKSICMGGSTLAEDCFLSDTGRISDGGGKADGL